MPHPTDLLEKPAPNFKLPSSTGDEVRIADFKGTKAVVLYFYPRADTPGCTTEACSFRDALADYNRANLAVLGVSPDDVLAVTKFARKYHLNFPLLADADHAVCEKYGVWQEKSMYGRKYFGVARTTFVIAKDGVVKHVFERVKPQGHDRQVLEWVNENLRQSRLGQRPHLPVGRLQVGGVASVVHHRRAGHPLPH